jgi:hypothetical protein
MLDLPPFSRMLELPMCATMPHYYSVLKRKEIPICAPVSMNLEDIMQSEISQSQKDKYCMIALT